MGPRGSRWWIVIGAAAGLFVWAYDAQFGLNAGGAEAPIARAILRACRLEDASMAVWVLWPPAALTMAGAVIGYAFAHVVAFGRRETGATRRQR